MSRKTYAASAAILTAFAAAASVQAAELSVTVEGVEDRGGQLFVSVQTAAEFMGQSGTDGSVIASPEAGATTVSYDLPPGEYAVTVWHDDDANGQFDFGPGGMPLDGWAMSGTMNGAPSFADAKVVVDEDGASVTMTMTYGR